jgi:ABC-type sugar transport system permease subunit
MASTPPVSSSSWCSDNSSDQNTSLVFLFTWKGYTSFNTPPEYIIVEVFSAADGTRLGAFPVPRRIDPCEKGATCIYSTSVSSVNFPNGDFMLVATDPLSGVAARQLVAVNTPGEGSRDFFRKFEQEQVFIVVSVVLTAFLVTILAILVREKNRT